MRYKSMKPEFIIKIRKIVFRGFKVIKTNVKVIRVHFDRLSVHQHHEEKTS